MGGIAMYLDCDTTPAIRSRYVRGKLQSSIQFASHLLTHQNAEGQIGVYESHGGDFRGYVIKYAGEEPYFEPAEEE
jgi:hypothetical protein